MMPKQQVHSTTYQRQLIPTQRGSHRANADKFVEVVNVDMDEHTKQARHYLLHVSDVISRKCHA